LYVTTNILAAYFAGTGQPHINFINSLIQAVLTITLDSIVVPRWSFYGAFSIPGAEAWAIPAENRFGCGRYPFRVRM